MRKSVDSAASAGHRLRARSAFFLLAILCVAQASWAAKPSASGCRDGVARATRRLVLTPEHEKHSFALLDQITPQDLVDPHRHRASRLSMNRWIRDLLEGSPPQAHARRLVSLDRTEAESVFRAIENHPVAGTCQLDFYDPTGATGFCFGVAEAVRMELVKRGLNPDSIRKAWAMGGLWLEESSWDYHVSALVRAKEGGWWAIDPTFAGPISAGEWIDRMEKANSRSKDLRLHLTSADRVTPVGSFDPSDREYRGFFKDLAETYQREHQARRRRPRSGGSR